MSARRAGSRPVCGSMCRRRWIPTVRGSS